MIRPGWAILLAYQGAWFACVLGGARGLATPGLLAAAATFGLACAGARHRTRLALFGVVTAAAGAATDAGVAALGWISFPTPAADWLGLPLWMLALWLAFAPCLPLLAGALAARPAAAAALGAAGGPLAYWAASRFDAVVVAAPAGWVMIAAEYALIVPLGCAIAVRAGLTTRTATLDRG